MRGYKSLFPLEEISDSKRCSTLLIQCCLRQRGNTYSGLHKGLCLWRETHSQHPVGLRVPLGTIMPHPSSNKWVRRGDKRTTSSVKQFSCHHCEAGPGPVWEAGWSPESEDNLVQPQEPINQSGLTTTFHRTLFTFIENNKKKRQRHVNRNSIQSKYFSEVFKSIQMVNLRRCRGPNTVIAVC